MFKAIVKDLKTTGMTIPLADMARRAFKMILSFRPGHILSEDAKYRFYFHTKFLPELYREHVRSNIANCVFCSHLVKSGCHKYCLKCSAGTYIKCYPPMPGLLYKGSIETDEGDDLPIPWYFKRVCSQFSRLPQGLYFRNLYSVFPSIALNNYEALESVEKGLLSGSKPCYICASVDYNLYKSCLKRNDFDTCTACHRIKHELKKIYIGQLLYIKSAV